MTQHQIIKHDSYKLNNNDNLKLKKDNNDNNDKDNNDKDKIIIGYHCDYKQCNKIFINYSLYNKHRRKHNKVFKCSFGEICNKSFSNQRDLTIHEKIHKGLKDEICKFCFSKFIHPSNLKKHIKYVHSNLNDTLILNQFICKKCNKTFNRKESLQRHLQSHLKRDLRKLIYCKICKTSFISISNYNRHKRIFNHY